MAINTTRWSIALLVLLSILPSVFGLYFYLEGSEQKCFTEELPKETVVTGKEPSGNRSVVSSRNVHFDHHQRNGINHQMEPMNIIRETCHDELILSFVLALLVRDIPIAHRCCLSKVLVC